MRNVAIVWFLFAGWFPYAQNFDLSKKQASNAQLKDSLNLLDSIASIHFVKGEYPRSLEYRLLIIELCEEEGMKSAIPHHLFEAGRCHYYMRSNDISNSRALKLINRSFRLASSVHDSTTMYRSARGLGAILGERDQFDSSFYYLKLARIIASSKNDLSSVSGILVIEATYHIKQDSNLLLAERLFANGHAASLQIPNTLYVFLQNLTGAPGIRRRNEQNPPFAGDITFQMTVSCCMVKLGFTQKLLAARAIYAVQLCAMVMWLLSLKTHPFPF